MPDTDEALGWISGNLTWSCHYPSLWPSCQMPAPTAFLSLFGLSVKKQNKENKEALQTIAYGYLCFYCYFIWLWRLYYGLVNVLCSNHLTDFSYQVQSDLSSIEDDLGVKVSLESIELRRKQEDFRNEDKQQAQVFVLLFESACKELTWLTVLLICGLGLYLRFGLWDQ